MSITSRFSVGRDTLVRYIFADNFFEKVPQLADLKELFEGCKTAYKEEAAKKGCSCRVTSAWAKDCLDTLMPILEVSKRDEHELIRNFIRCVGGYSADADVDQVGITILYDTPYDIFVDTSATEEKAEPNADV